MELKEKSTVKRVRRILDHVCASPELHAKWLNTLSYLEHIGATKIARTQSGQKAGLMSLKHAAEEARHAYYLKRIILKLIPGFDEPYSNEWLFSPVESKQLLYALDLRVSRMLKSNGRKGEELNWLTYLLVTYAIEVRADEMYPIYQEYLEKQPVKMSVLSIINEEEGHLEEMETELDKIGPVTVEFKRLAIGYEQNLFQNWLSSVEKELIPSAVV